MSEDPIMLRSVLNRLKRRYKITNLSMDDIVKQNELLKVVIAKQDLQIKQIINGYRTKERVINSAVEIANKTNNEYLQEINELRKEIKCLSQ